MSRPSPIPAQSVLRELFNYDAETGVFTWAKKLQYRPDVFGKVAGALKTDGYWNLRIAGRLYVAHRIAWVWHHGGNIDDLEIDHIDLNKSNNAIANLRIATRSQNLGNTRTRSNNKLGLKGVYRIKKGRCRYKASIKIGGKATLLGHFFTPEEAAAAYARAAQLHFGNFARTE